WDCFKRWLCFRNTPVHLTHIPTQRPAPQWTYGVCREGPGCAGKAGAGCADGRCGPGFAAGGKPAKGAAVAGCAPCPAPGEVVMPGYRLANPESPGMNAPRTAGPVVNPVAPAGYKVPPAAVPYKGGTMPTQQRPYIGQ
ncbi:MAG: hypothetical protein K2X82_13845, partial [Gemmataceae bacterium]|nr:hypothetical protein [Gemmataceae bacterium]